MASRIRTIPDHGKLNAALFHGAIDSLSVLGSINLGCEHAREILNGDGNWTLYHIEFRLADCRPHRLLARMHRGSPCGGKYIPYGAIIFEVTT